MSVSVQLLDALKASQGGCSDYRVAQILGVAQQTVAKYRKEIAPMSAERVIQICELTGLDAKEWVLKLYRERARCTAEVEIIDDLLTRAAA